MIFSRLAGVGRTQNNSLLIEENLRMFAAEVYLQRRKRLARNMGKGIILFLGNTQSPINFLDNVYSFRQDSSFLYFWGLKNAGLAAVIDVDESSETLFGDDMTLEESVWAGPQPFLGTLCEEAAIQTLKPADHLERILSKAVGAGRPVHFLPQYRADIVLKLSRLLDINPDFVRERVSTQLIRAVVF